MLRLAINGYGRIGRSILRALLGERVAGAGTSCRWSPSMNWRMPATVLHLTRYDSTHGRFPGLKLPSGDESSLDRRPGPEHNACCNVTNHIEDLPWRELGCRPGAGMYRCLYRPRPRQQTAPGNREQARYSFPSQPNPMWTPPMVSTASTRIICGRNTTDGVGGAPAPPTALCR